MDNQIKELRTKRGLTQLQLAEMLGVERSTVANWETGISNPRPSMFPKIVEALKLRNINQIFLISEVK